MVVEYNSAAMLDVGSVVHQSLQVSLSVKSVFQSVCQSACLSLFICVSVSLSPSVMFLRVILARAGLGPAANNSWRAGSLCLDVNIDWSGEGEGEGEGDGESEGDPNFAQE